MRKGGGETKSDFGIWVYFLVFLFYWEGVVVVVMGLVVIIYDSNVHNN